MAVDFKISVTGCDEVAAALAKLPDRLQDKYGARGLAAAAEVTATAIRARVPINTGLLMDSIGATRVKFYRQSGTLFSAVGPRKGFRRTVQNPSKASLTMDPRRYFHLLETGRKDVSPIDARALHPALSDSFFGHAKGVTGHAILQPARDSVADGARTMILIELEKGVDEWNAQNSAAEGST